MREFWEILGKYRILDVGSLGSKGLRKSFIQIGYLELHILYNHFCVLSFHYLLCFPNVIIWLTHSRLRMPQSSPGQGRGMPQGILSIGNMLVFTIIFDIYDTYAAEVSDHMSLPYSFSFNCHKGG